MPRQWQHWRQRRQGGDDPTRTVTSAVAMLCNQVIRWTRKSGIGLVVVVGAFMVFVRVWEI